MDGPGALAERRRTSASAGRQDFAVDGAPRPKRLVDGASERLKRVVEACESIEEGLGLVVGTSGEDGREALQEARGEQALAGLQPLVGRFDGLVRDVRGLGLMLGVEFDSAEHAEEVQWACFERGLLVLECGASSVRLSPPLTVSEPEMDSALRLFSDAVAQVAGNEADIRQEAIDAGVLHEVEAAG